MIHLTNSAVGALQTAISASKEPVQGLRIMVEAGGCAGMKYMMGLVATGEDGDQKIEQSGITLFVDPASNALIDGTTIDFVVGMEGAGFTFENPNASSSCSCGKSFG